MDTVAEEGCRDWNLRGINKKEHTHTHRHTHSNRITLLSSACKANTLHRVNNTEDTFKKITAYSIKCSTVLGKNDLIK